MTDSVIFFVSTDVSADVNSQVNRTQGVARKLSIEGLTRDRMIAFGIACYGDYKTFL